MIIDGKQIVREIIEGLAQERGSLPPVLKLGFVVGEADAAAASFVKIKERIAEELHVVVVREEVATTKQALAAVARLAQNTHGIVVQLPLPWPTNTDVVLAAIPKNKDVDFSNPPVAQAIEEILRRSNSKALGKRAVVVGSGRLVGAPAAELLRKLGAKVEVVDFGQSLEPLKTADIVVLGAGSPGLIKPEMLKQGVILLDAGTSNPPAGAKGSANGRIVGDAAPECAQVASVFTPVPGGIGPIAVAMLFKNLFALVKAQDV